MPQSLSKVYLHIVFSTKHRQNLIHPNLESELYSYMGGIIKTLNGSPININGTSNHIHILTTLPRTITIAKILEEIKKSSSKWIKTKGIQYSKFSWQGGYGVFSVSQSGVAAVSTYIDNQKEHHKTKSFKEELISFLDKYETHYEEKYVWD